ncbi:MAG TPA: FAD-binding oxidoreductase, partial [Candidatus Sulfotelmatobacter sp.]|nr:FAD-binding oxidoreductase [Candidatus Sulfotelmatobacter sp.]
MSAPPPTDLIAELRRALGESAVLTGAAVAERPATQRQPTGCAALALVRPATTDELTTVMRLCHAAGQPVVPRGGMTGLVSGTQAQANEIALSLERMNRVEELDPVSQTITVQAGVPLQAVQDYAAERGFLFPLDLGARGSCTIGGNISTNAGGNKVIRYGMMRDMVLGLEAVLPDGTVVSSLFKIIKNNTGLDLKQLFIGTEGTLGIVTRAVLRLRPLPNAFTTAFLAFSNFASVTRVLAEMQRALGGALSSYEVLWRDYYRLVTEAGRNAPPVSREHPFVALVEAEGNDAESDGARFQATLESCLEQGSIADAVLAQSETERRALWKIRDDVHYLREIGPSFTFDVSLPIAAMDGYIADLCAAAAGRWSGSQVHAFGHLGDGNLHVIVACNGGPEAKQEVENLVYGPLEAVRGSVSAEHGIGLDKKAYLSFSRSPAEIALMAAVKRTLDPKNI